MKGIRLEQVTKLYQGRPVISDVNLHIPEGSFFALLGPSGSGKTTILRLIAGFESADSGTIFLGDNDITHTPSYERRVNTVFQQYALFPHMNVFENVAYGLRIKGLAASMIEQKVMDVLAMVNLQELVYRSALQLSGGQQQRVALARAIVNEPEVLLLDEPLAALDLKLRERMLIELMDLQSKLETTFVYVTHDQFDALTVADSMAIMHQDGAIEQVGIPKDIYEFPASRFVAEFVGSANIFSGVLRVGKEGSFLEVEGLDNLEVTIPEDKRWMCTGSRVFMSIRPEKIEISKGPTSGFAIELQGEVVAVVYHGRSTQYTVRLANAMLLQVFEQNEEHFPRDEIEQGDNVHLYWQAENAVLLER